MPVGSSGHNFSVRRPVFPLVFLTDVDSLPNLGATLYPVLVWPMRLKCRLPN